MATGTINVRVRFRTAWLRVAFALYLLAECLQRLGRGCIDRSIRIDP